MGNYKLYICTTDSCNLACKGCYKTLFSRPSFIDLDKVKSYILSFLRTSESDTLECVFHGGEPFLYKDKLQDYINLIDFCKSGRITWSATTNLMYEITDMHLDLFNRFDFKFLKTSWDVDDYRFTTKEQLELWEKNVKLLLEKEFIVQPIVTVNTQTIKHDPKELLEYFKSFRIKIVNFERITETGRAAKVKVKPTNREIDEWLYKAYLISKELDIVIPLFNELEHALTDGFIGCRKRQCMKNVRTLNTDGSIGACPNCSDICITDKYGKYQEENEHYLLDMENELPIKCKFCEFYKICHGDCCQLKWDETGCPGLTLIYKDLLK